MSISSTASDLTRSVFLRSSSSLSYCLSLSNWAILSSSLCFCCFIRASLSSSRAFLSASKRSCLSWLMRFLFSSLFAAIAFLNSWLPSFISPLMLLLQPALQMIVDKLRSIIRVDASLSKRRLSEYMSKGFAYPVLSFVPYGSIACPERIVIRQCQRPCVVSARI